ncbi:MAG: hypothetical protein ACE5HX_13320 [bacterium]
MKIDKKALLKEFESRFYECWNATDIPNPENVKSFMWNFFVKNILEERRKQLKNLFRRIR